ncbi:cupredoxin family copper-binding protein [Streptomyces sp. NPDC050428]|uniref:cupredoxin domain-containing protein n=1 Tax=Streptomyces sp. NPDC050428 TaxID=3155757 RepID=UPI003416088D
MDDEQTNRRRAPSRLGNRVLLAVGLGAAVTAVAGLALLQSASGTPASPTVPVAAQAAQPEAQAAQPAAAQQVKAADYTIVIKDMAYAQPKLTVEVGQTVTWVNEDTAPHTVTTSSGPDTLDSGNLAKGDSWSFTFTKAGVYDYYCAVHPDMVAGITVVESGSGSTGGSGSSGGSGSGGTDSGGGTSGGSDAGGSDSGGSHSGGSSGGSHSGGSSSGGSDSGGSSSGGSSSGGSSSGGSGGGNDAQCASFQQVLKPILQHLNAAHLETSPGQQVKDALELDSYIKMHTVWVESILTPAVNGSGAIADDALSVLLQHVKSAHLETSLGQQIQDALQVDSYVKTHTVWAKNLAAPVEKYVTESC